MRPIIGVTAAHNTADNRFFLSTSYVEAVIDNGGIPILISYLPEEDMTSVLSSIDGLILTGGGDINPLVLNEEPSPYIGEISTLRDVFEIAFAKKAMEYKIPILGICRGMQVLCVAAGGTLIQDIPSCCENYICHNQKAPRHEETHFISVKEGTFLRSLTLSEKTPVNSFHHQAVLNCGHKFNVSALSSDGIIEAIESKDDFFLGVQWHPETLFKKNKIQKNLFAAFIDRAGKN